LMSSFCVFRETIVITLSKSVGNGKKSKSDAIAANTVLATLVFVCLFFFIFCVLASLEVALVPRNMSAKRSKKVICRHQMYFMPLKRSTPRLWYPLS